MQKEYFGNGAIGDLARILEEISPSSIFLVTGTSSYENSGVRQRIEPCLSQYSYFHFHGFSGNPQIKDVEKGVRLFKENGCDFVVAIGGGSILDVAKSISILSSQDSEPQHYVTKELYLRQKVIPMVAIPTTSGTGSEATHFAVVYIGKEKYSLAHKSMLPDYSILDPELTLSLSPKVTASTGMDAFCQAVESYWCVNSTDESKGYAEEAIKLIIPSLDAAVNNLSLESRTAMMKAANLAGKAINITKTTACHAISYPISSYFDVPHGHAVVLTLPEMFLYNAAVTAEDCSDVRGTDYVKRTMEELVGLFGTQNPEEAKLKIENLIDSIRLKRKLSDLGIDSNEDFDIIITNGFNPDRVKNNPREVKENDLREILLKIR